MPIGDPYASLTELKARLSITDAVDDAALTAAVDGASREIEDHTRRQFNAEETATARRYYAVSRTVCAVDDFHTTTGLVVETDDDLDGVYETAWTAADFQLEPIEGVHHGRTGWPFWRLVAVGSPAFPTSSRAAVRVTAQWGWGAVPAQVKEATLILAEEIFKLKDAPFGVAGFGEFGVVRVRDNPAVARKLKPYRRGRRTLLGRTIVGV